MSRNLICLISFAWVLAGVVTSTAQSADPNLVGWWSFEEESGVLKDKSDYQNDGTPTGGVMYQQSGVTGFSLGFNGIDSYVTVGKNGRPQDTFTFGGWIKTSRRHEIDDESNSTGGTESGVYNQRYPIFPLFEMSGAGAGLSVGINGISVYESGSGYVPATAVYEAQIGDDWNHIVVVYEARTPTIFLNGQAVHTGMMSGKGLVMAPIMFGGYIYGFFEGQIDEIHIYNRALEPTEVEQLMLRDIEVALNPAPFDGELNVDREVVLSWKPGVTATQHDVFFGINADDVNSATTTVDPSGVYMGRQASNTYAAGRLDFGQTYYWRVDEIAPGKTIKGKTWQFSVEPFAHPLATEKITATASSSSTADEVPERTIDGSGLSGDGLHGTKETTMWLSSDTGTSGAWIQYDFDNTYLLHEMLVWNYNSMMEPFVGLGVKDVTIDTTTNGTDWTALGQSHQFAQAPGTERYAANTAIDLGDVPLKGIRLNVVSNWGGMLLQYGLSEVHFTRIPLAARVPKPASGSTGLETNVTLNWRKGRQAATHDVYLSADEQAVIDGTAPVTTVSETSYDTGELDLGVTYYWKVNETNEVEDPPLWVGDVWNFTVVEYQVVDDFESYNDFNPDDPNSNRVFLTWIDGWQVPTNGSLVGYAEAPFCEQTIVHGGNQSMPLDYDNTGTAVTSEAGRTWDTPQDWTANGIKELSVMVRGQETNTADVLYVGIQDAAGKKAVLYHPGGADVVVATSQTEWATNLQDAAAQGVDLTRVKTLYLGVGDQN
ncbi:MAG: LamG-like jellyroll fold domain-containing protein, partial [Planctomycetota bacterium]